MSKVIGLFMVTEDDFVADVLRDPGRFVKDALKPPDPDNPNPRVSEDIAYVAVPRKTWNHLQDFLDNEGLRSEAKNWMKGTWVMGIPRKNVGFWEKKLDEE